MNSPHLVAIIPSWSPASAVCTPDHHTTWSVAVAGWERASSLRVPQLWGASWKRSSKKCGGKWAHAARPMVRSRIHVTPQPAPPWSYKVTAPHREQHIPRSLMRRGPCGVEEIIKKAGCTSPGIRRTGPPSQLVQLQLEALQLSKQLLLKQSRRRKIAYLYSNL